MWFIDMYMDNQRKSLELDVSMYDHAVVWPNGVSRLSNLVLGLSWQSFVCACVCVWRGTEEVHYLYFTRRLQRSLQSAGC